MSAHLAFLRAINVAGHGRIAMADLREVFHEAGAREVSTYIQTGNVLFEATRAELPAIRRAVGKGLLDRMGATVPVYYRTRREFARLVQDAPFAGAADGDDVKLYVSLLSRRPRRRPRLPLRVEKEALTLIAVGEREAYLVSGRKPNGFYGFPNELVERELGVEATSRNWNTLQRIAERLES